METKEKILKEIEKVKSLERKCDPNFSQYAVHAVASTYIGYINGTINITDRDDIVVDIGDMTKWYNRNCKCTKKST